MAESSNRNEFAQGSLIRIRPNSGIEYRTRVIYVDSPGDNVVLRIIDQPEIVPDPQGESTNQQQQGETPPQVVRSTNFLRMFGFWENRLCIYIHVLVTALVLIAMALLIGFGGKLLGFETRGGATIFCVLVPSLCFALPPLCFLLQVGSSPDRLRFFLSKTPRFSNVSCIVLAPFCFVLSEGLELLISHGTKSTEENLTWHIIRSSFWSYFLTVYIMTAAIFLLRVDNCRREIEEMDELLRGDENQATKEDRLSKLNQTFDGFGSIMSFYMLAQVAVASFTISVPFVLFHRIRQNRFHDIAQGATHFSILASIQAITLWILIPFMAYINSKAKNLAKTALNTYARAELDRPTDNGVRGLRLIDHIVDKCTGSLSVFGFRVGVSFVTFVLSTHISFFIFVGGPLMA